MKLFISHDGLLRLTAENQAEMMQLNRLLNQVSLTASAAIEQAVTVESLQETKFISLQLQTSKEAKVAEVAKVKVGPETESAVTLEVTPVPPVNLDVVVIPNPNP